MVGNRIKRIAPSKILNKTVPLQKSNKQILTNFGNVNNFIRNNDKTNNWFNNIITDNKINYKTKRKEENLFKLDDIMSDNQDISKLLKKSIKYQYEESNKTYKLSKITDELTKLKNYSIP